MKIFIDCDGVLTDGKLYMGSSGEKMFKAFHTKDVAAMRELVFRGFEVTIVTADDWFGTAHFAEKVGAKFLVLRDKSEIADRTAGPYWALGDDVWDVPMLRRAVKAFAPKGAAPCVNILPNVQQLDAYAGEGVVAAMIQLCLREKIFQPL